MICSAITADGQPCRAKANETGLCPMHRRRPNTGRLKSTGKLKCHVCAQPLKSHRLGQCAPIEVGTARSRAFNA